MYFFHFWSLTFSGIPVTVELEKLLAKKDDKKKYHRERQQTREYKARQKGKQEKKKKKRQEEEKASKKRKHTYEKKDLHQHDKENSLPKKKIKLEFEEEDIVFVKFASIHYYGIILEVEIDADSNKPQYMIRFLDGELRDSLVVGRDIVRKMKPELRCWVPNEIFRASVTYEKFQKHISAFDMQLEQDYENFLIGELEIASTGSDESSEEEL